ncbi:MAG TPA: phytanoyl-CoA dioxygenase family protein [Aliidongia sp.]|nr:phytanoyl-CoA dioxygenase family protein [Aliidongia sp.]
MRVSDAKLAEVRERGFATIEGFLDSETLAEAQAALWRMHPRPEEYFADPGKYPRYGRSQFAGINLFPYEHWALNRVGVYPDLIDAAERLLGSADLDIYKIELWAKYAGAIDYAQPHHRDYGNHTLVVPRRDGLHMQMTTFILLSDVTEADGPTCLVPLEHSQHLPFTPSYLEAGALRGKEVAATGPAGSLMIYRTDVFHRASSFAAPDRARFAMLVDFAERGWRWHGKLAWPNQANNKGMVEAMVRMTPRQRDLFGWPPAGSDYWNEQTLADVAERYPGMDMSPYRG